MKRFVLALVATLALPTLACAQSSPGFVNGQVPSATDWNGYFSAKQDVSPVLTQIAGKTLQGNGTKVQLSIGSPISGNCTKFDANGNTVDAGAPCGSGAGSLTVTDGTTSVTSTTTLTMGSGLVVGGSAGSATLNLTAPSIAYSSNHTVGASDMGGNLFLTGSGTLTIPAISSTVFASQMTLCATNTGTGVWQWSSTPTINGLTGTVIPSGKSFCLVSNGTSLDAMVGSHGAVTPAAITIATSTFTPSGAYINYTIGLTSACPCTLANFATTPNAGSEGTIAISQDGTGSRTIGTWGSNYYIEGGTSAISLSTGANAVDIFAYHSDGTKIYLTFASKGAIH